MQKQPQSIPIYWPPSAPPPTHSYRLFGHSPPPSFKAPLYPLPLLSTDYPLPSPYPPPTAPGCLELKSYPPERRAECKSYYGDPRQCLVLYKHLKRRKMGFTGPVVSDFCNNVNGGKQGCTMSQVYRDKDQGRVEIAENGVIVRDQMQVTVLSIGISCHAITLSIIQQALNILNKLLQSQQEWVRLSEEPRLLLYNGPSAVRKWAEVQVIVKKSE
ncbi:hypothetical protein FGO68_gene16646 [Halteria grandinella]|uniref:Uncharacterized protein n=1 Tax=Halteria grandinella TaxID=5974 RepID=A0A8J8NIG2_HALGN|nr:hypothetical protein FGO68_gene16646 [Halteria grandinella]